MEGVFWPLQSFHLCSVGRRKYGVKRSIPSINENGERMRKKWRKGERSSKRTVEMYTLSQVHDKHDAAEMEVELHLSTCIIVSRPI